jgi:uncharacterized protein (DUF952 family)
LVKLSATGVPAGFTRRNNLDPARMMAHHRAEMIYKIFRDAEWRQLERDGQTRGAPIDLADGFIHFSAADTVRETARLYFAGMPDLWLLAVDDRLLGDALKWEVSRGGQRFPHLFGALRLTDVLWCKPLPVGPEGHEFPGDLP